MADTEIKPMSQDGDRPDPTGNVLLLVEAAVKRLDDLRDAETRRIDGIAALRAEYEGKLRDAEAKRIDAIRAVDVGNVAIESERQAAQANVLANQVATSAETLRGLVATTAQAQAQQTAQSLGQITERIASLEKAQYEGTGKQSVVDPQITALLAEMRSVRESGSERKGAKDMTGWIFGGIATAVTIGIALFMALRN